MRACCSKVSATAAPTVPCSTSAQAFDYGEAFVGNIGGKTAVSDFTAVGDVVNTAARLQAFASGGEVVVAQRLAQFLDEPAGPLEQLSVKGKHEPVAAQRVRWFERPNAP